MAVDDKQSTLALAPLGPGDLIDRAVRLYRQNFLTFIWIAAPPVVFGSIITILWRILALNIFNVDRVNHRTEAELYLVFLWFGSFVIWVVELVAGFTVMGGASRNFVRHLLFGEPITFRETYKNVKTRFFSLLGASTMITIMLGVIGIIVFFVMYIAVVLAVLLAVAAFSFSPFVATIVSVLLALGIMFGSGWLFFLVAGNFMYVPQAMLVEGQGVFSAMGRSSSLARGNVKRLYALFAFTLLAIYSALALFYVPLGWYAWVEGIQIMSFDPDTIPAWYQIAGQFVWQASLILLMPVWMIGLCILYVDERVRHEGYDIELMAARRLGEIPAVPDQFVNPLQPAISKQARVPDAPQPAPPTQKPRSTSTLGLD